LHRLSELPQFSLNARTGHCEEIGRARFSRLTENSVAARKYVTTSGGKSASSTDSIKIAFDPDLRANPTEKKMIRNVQTPSCKALDDADLAARANARRSRRDTTASAIQFSNSSRQPEKFKFESVKKRSCSRDELISTLREILAKARGLLSGSRFAQRPVILPRTGRALRAGIRARAGPACKPTPCCNFRRSQMQIASGLSRAGFAPLPDSAVRKCAVHEEKAIARRCWLPSRPREY